MLRFRDIHDDAHHRNDSLAIVNQDKLRISLSGDLPSYVGCGSSGEGYEGPEFKSP